MNTNFARTGEEGEGSGYLRFERATELFGELAGAKVPFETILTRFSRDIGHVLLRRPTWEDMQTAAPEEPVWISTRDSIDRYHTSATVVIEGRRPGVAGSVATMWVIPGEPLCAVAVPLLVEAGSSPAVLSEGEPDAPMWAEGLLRDSDPGVRRLAAEILVEAEYTPAIDDLEAAVRVERGEDLREALQEDLEALEKIVAVR